MTVTSGLPDRLARPPAFDELLANVQALTPGIRARRREINDLGQLPADLVRDLRTSGVFGAAVPTERGGSDLDSIGQLRIVEELAKADPSVAWCVMIGIDSGIFTGYLQPETADVLYPRPDMITAGWIPPVGKGERVSGGYLISGRWRFGTGCTHADVFSAGFRTAATDEADSTCLVALADASRFDIVPTWTTIGLAGSGSHDYLVNRLFVPEEHTFCFTRPVLCRTLDRRSDAILRKMPGVPLGTAQAALTYVETLADGRTLPSGVRWTDAPQVWSALANAEAQLRSARSYVYNSVESLWSQLVGERQVTAEARIDAALARWNAFRSARAVVTGLCDLVGGDALYEDTNPLGQWLRDVMAMSQHVVAQERVLEWCGRLVLGDEPGEPFV